MIRPVKSGSLTLFLLLGAATSAAAQTTINTQAQATSTTAFTNPSATGVTVGQTFVVPNATDLLLTSFRVSRQSFQAVSYTARLFEYVPGTISTRRFGTLLWTGATKPLAASTTPPPLPYETFDIGQTLQVGKTYVFALTFTPPATGSSVRMHTSAGLSQPNVYAGGEYVFEQTTNVGQLQTAGGLNASGGADLGFTAQFGPTTVPEPATLSLLGLGALGIVVARRRRNSR